MEAIMVEDMGTLQTVVQDLEKRLSDNESEIQRLINQLQDWSRKAHDHCPACGVRSVKARAPKRAEFYDLPLTDAAMMCLIEFDYPISPKILRLKLEEKGYPKSKLGRYANRLHTVIWRLIDSGRIRREEGDEIIAIR
jgi:hypothetical protein